MVNVPSAPVVALSGPIGRGGQVTRTFPARLAGGVSVVPSNTMRPLRVIVVAPIGASRKTRSGMSRPSTEKSIVPVASPSARDQACTRLAAASWRRTVHPG